MDHDTHAYRPELPTPELITAIQALLVDQRKTERLLCRYVADLADRIAERGVGFMGRGFSDIYHATRSLFSMSVRATRDRVRIGRALRELPLLEEAFLDGQVGYSQVREVTRVAKPETEKQWLALARTLPMRTLERRVREAGGSGLVRDRTSEPAVVTWSNERVVEVRFTLRAETWALLHRALEGARRAAAEDGLVSDDVALAAVARDALARQAASETNEVHRTVVLYECSTCERTEVETGGGAVELDDGAAAALGCGARVRDLRTEGRIERRGGPIPKSVERAVRLRDRSRCRVPGCSRRRYVDVHHVKEQAQGGVHSRRNCLCLCDTHHRMLHEGALSISGDPEGALDFRDAGGEPMVDPRHAPARDGRDPIGSCEDDDAEMAANGARLLAVMGKRGGWDMDTLCEASGLEVAAACAAMGLIQIQGKVRMETFGRYRAAP